MPLRTSTLARFLPACVFLAAGCQATGLTTHNAAQVHPQVSPAGALPPSSLALQRPFTRKDTTDAGSRVMSAMVISQAPVSSAQLESALDAASQANAALAAANDALLKAQDSETKAAAAAAAAADMLTKANQLMADANTKLADAQAAADAAQKSGDAALVSATQAALAQAEAAAAAASASQAQAKADAASSAAALAQAQSQAASATAAQAIAKANDAAAQAALAAAQSAAAAGTAAQAQAQSQSAVTAANAANAQSQTAAAQAAQALSTANGLSGAIATSGSKADAAAAAAAQALQAANDLAAKLATPTPGPVLQVSTFVSAGLNRPNGLAIDGSGTLYVADAGNNAIKKIAPDGSVTLLAGGTRGYVDAQGSTAQFSSPYGVAVDKTGVVYVADTYNHCIRKIALDGTVATLAGNGVKGFADATGQAAQFNAPFSLDVDAAGNLYVADAGNNRIRKVTPAGVVTTLAGSGAQGRLDGQGIAAQFAMPSDLALDPAGTLYVADLGNHEIRGIAPDGTVTTLAGNGIPGALDGAGPTAQFNSPSGVALTADGTLYVADSRNNRIRKVTRTGQVSTLAGSGLSGSADANANDAAFKGPTDLAITATGGIYVSDTYGDRIRLIK